MPVSRTNPAIAPSLDSAHHHLHPNAVKFPARLRASAPFINILLILKAILSVYIVFRIVLDSTFIRARRYFSVFLASILQSPEDWIRIKKLDSIVALFDSAKASGKDEERQVSDINRNLSSDLCCYFLCQSRNNLISRKHAAAQIKNRECRRIDLARESSRWKTNARARRSAATNRGLRHQFYSEIAMKISQKGERDAWHRPRLAIKEITCRASFSRGKPLASFAILSDIPRWNLLSPVRAGFSPFPRRKFETLCRHGRQVFIAKKTYSRSELRFCKRHYASTGESMYENSKIQCYVALQESFAIGFCAVGFFEIRYIPFAISTWGWLAVFAIKTLTIIRTSFVAK